MFLCVLLVVLSHSGQTLTLPPDAFTVPLDAEELHTLYWTLDYDAQTVSLEAHFRVPDDNWVALGFSDYGEITDADLCVLWAEQDGTRHLEDTWTDKAGVLYRDQSQDCESAGFQRTGHSTIFHFTRKFNTSDRHDYIIEEGTTHVVWASGADPLLKLDGLNIASAQHGLQRTDLLKNLQKISLPPDTFTALFTKDNFKVPPKSTTYWCKVMKLPVNFRKKHHIVKFEPILPPNQNKNHFVHHLKLFGCETTTDKELSFDNLCDPWPVELSDCKKNTLGLWVLGANPFYYPEEAGVPIGGPDFNRYVLLESHYNNPELRDDLVITAGLRLCVTPTLRAYDADVVELGYYHEMAVPPNHSHFVVNGYCSPSCTRSLPPEGITVFGTQLHTHQMGRRVAIRHVRDGQILPDIARDDHYSTYHQEIRLLKRPVHVLPGDSLITTCVYDTRGRSRVTWFGKTAADEMCLSFVFYYPRSNMFFCKSQLNLPEALDSLLKLGNQPALSDLELYDSSEGAVTSEHPITNVCLNHKP